MWFVLIAGTLVTLAGAAASFVLLRNRQRLRQNAGPSWPRGDAPKSVRVEAESGEKSTAPANAPTETPATEEHQPSQQNAGAYDFALAESRFAGHQRVWLLLLTQFLGKYEGLDDRWESLAAGVDAGKTHALEELLRELHTLKGHAGGVGAIALAQHAERVEHAIDETTQAEELNATLGRLREELAQACDAVRRLVENTNDT